MDATAVMKDYDYKYDDKRCQIKASRFGGKDRSFVAIVPKTKNDE